MIVWLASYPRSGNTLLRQVLKGAFGMGSYSDDPVPAHVMSRRTTEEFGHLDYAEKFRSWEEFYQHASAADEMTVVKTHRLPRDGAAALLVVRDGRLAIDSYHRFLKAFFPEAERTVIDLILGYDFYSDWTTFHQAWLKRPGITEVLRFNDLVEPESDVLKRIAEMIGFRGEPARWTNELDRLRESNPDFFRSGKTEWNGSVEWSAEHEQVFRHLHGSMMERLGFEDGSRALLDIGWQTIFDDCARSARRAMEEVREKAGLIERQSRVIEELAASGARRTE